MTSTLRCNVVPDASGFTDPVEAVFDANGQLLVIDTAPGVTLPESFEVEAEDGVVFSVVRGEGGYVIEADDMDMFVAMVFG